MKKVSPEYTRNRRSILQAMLGLSVFGVAATPVNAALKTPKATEGPFYPTDQMRFSDTDNNLVKIEGLVKKAGGEVIILRGRVLDADENPVKNARVEIWQCDVNGHYLHTGDANPVVKDMYFQGFGHAITDDDGKYLFRTIKPVSYPGRTPHIHVKVFASGSTMTTQFYIQGHAQNTRDQIFRRMSDKERAAVEMVFDTDQEYPTADVNITL